MYLETKNPVTFNAGITGQESNIIRGRLIPQNPTVWESDFDTLGANFMYEKIDGTPVANGGFRVQGEDIETLYNAVKDQVPQGSDFRTTQRYLFYLGFMQQMASTFGITTADITLVID